MFIDEAIITIKSGNGGNGCVSFRREKYVPKGGPDGGDGGDGGSVFFVASNDMHTLMDFKYKTMFKAADGKHGMGSNMHGKCGEDIEIKVPVGTQVYNAKTNELICDLTTLNQKVLILKGGRGGRGNARFANAIRQAPRYCELGEEGQTLEVKLVLKLIADIGLVGFPNAGKSTLLSKISNATPKIADYPFTTLRPYLGTVRLDYNKVFVVADIPGIIEGAHKGLGLGNKFLKHIERTKAIVYVIDATGFERDPLSDLKQLHKELKLYSEKLVNLPFIIALNKMDIPDSALNAQKILKSLKRLKNFKNAKVIEISALTGLNINLLLNEMYKLKELADSIKFNEQNEKENLENNNDILVIDEKQEFLINELGDSWTTLKNKKKKEQFDINIQKISKNEYKIESNELLKEIKRINFKTDDAMYFFKQFLKKYKIDQKLYDFGVRNGDTVYIGDFVFEYQNE